MRNALAGVVVEPIQAGVAPAQCGQTFRHPPGRGARYSSRSGLALAFGESGPCRLSLSRNRSPPAADWQNHHQRIRTNTINVTTR